MTYNNEQDHKGQKTIQTILINRLYRLYRIMMTIKERCMMSNNKYQRKRNEYIKLKLSN